MVSFKATDRQQAWQKMRDNIWFPSIEALIMRGSCQLLVMVKLRDQRKKVCPFCSRCVLGESLRGYIEILFTRSSIYHFLISYYSFEFHSSFFFLSIFTNRGRDVLIWYMKEQDSSTESQMCRPIRTVT